MDDLGVVTPLVLLPGVALLVISTSTRYAQLHEEFHRLLVSTEPTTVDLARHLLARARLFRNALIALYTSVCLFALGSHHAPLVRRLARRRAGADILGNRRRGVRLAAAGEGGAALDERDW